MADIIVQPKVLNADGATYDNLIMQKANNATNANNSTNVTTSINGKAIATIFEADGTTVKNSTNATNATNLKTSNISSNSISFILKDNSDSYIVTMEW